MSVENLALAELDGGQLAIPSSVFHHFQSGLTKSPDSPAVIATHQSPTRLSELLSSKRSSNAQCLSWTYTELHWAAMRVVAGLSTHNITPGATLMTFIGNGIENCLLLWVSAVLRLTLVPLDPGALSQARSAELANYINRLKPDVVCVTSSEGAEAVEAVLKTANAPSIKLRLVLVGPALEDWTILTQLAESGAAHPLDSAETLQAALLDDPNRTALITFTSGTSSGTPKGVPRHVASLSVGAESDPLRLNHADDKPPRFLLSTPNFRIIAPTLCIAVWRAGGAIVIPPPSSTGGFNVPGSLEAIENHSVTTLVLIPVMLHMLVADPTFLSREMDSLHTVMMGADIITKDIFAKARKFFGQSTIMIVHGMTETGPVFAWPFHESPPEEIPTFGEICPLGVPAKGVRVRVWDDEQKRVLRCEEPGELCLSGETVTKGYLDGASPQSFYSDSVGRKWFRTGDLSVINNDGVVFILGRLKDIVKRGGLSITPAALESCIKAYTGEEMSIIAVPHPQLGQEPFAILKKRSEKSFEEIQAHVFSILGKDYALAGIVSLDELDLKEFPRNASAKVEKFELEKRVTEWRRVKAA